jgi:hypothetical protein
LPYLCTQACELLKRGGKVGRAAQAEHNLAKEVIYMERKRQRERVSKRPHSADMSESDWKLQK